MALIPTSLQAYADLFASGVIGQLQYQLLEFVRQHQDDSSMSEGVSRADVELYFADANQSFGPRFKELHAMGLLKVSGFKYSPKGNGRRVQCWRTSSHINTDKLSPDSVSTKVALDTLCKTVRDVCLSMPESSHRRIQLIKAVKLAESRKAKPKEE